MSGTHVAVTHESLEPAMPEIDIDLSPREAERIERYAERKGITPAQAINRLCNMNLDDRLRFSRAGGEVKTFPSLKKD